MTKYLSILKQDKNLFPLLSPIHRRFHQHLVAYGPDVPFPDYTIHELHEYLLESGIPGETIIRSIHKHPPSSDFHDSDVLVPQANAAAMASPATK